MSTIIDVDESNKSLSDNYIIPLKIYDIEDVRIGDYVVNGGFFPTAGCSLKIEKKLSDRTLEVPICFLNGGTMEVSLEEDLKDRTQLRFNLSMGKDIIRHTQKTIVYSSNYMQRASVFRAWEHCIQRSDTDEEVLDKPIGCFSPEQLMEARSQRKGLKKHYGVSNEVSLHKKMLATICRAIFECRSDMENIIAKAVYSRCGNCLEMGLVGWKYAKDRFPRELVEVFEINQGDHLFLVIGREVDSDLSDYKSWGLNAVVCDPWSGGCYPVNRLENFLMDFSKELQLSGVTIPCVTSFDPSYQSLTRINLLI